MWYLLGDKRWFALGPMTLFSWSLRLKVSLLHLKSWSFSPIKMTTMIIYMCFIIIQVKSMELRFLKRLTFSIPLKLLRFGSDYLTQNRLSSEPKPWELRLKRLEF